MDMLKGIDVKVFATEGDAISPYDFVAVLQRWIREHTVPGVLIDVADYSHIPNGPGVILVGHEGNTSIDYGEGRLGLLYRYKNCAEDTNAGRIETAVNAALNAAKTLQDEPEFQGRLSFDTTTVDVIANDRLQAPSTDEAYSEFSAAVTEATGKVFSSPSIDRKQGDARERLTATVSS